MLLYRWISGGTQIPQIVVFPHRGGAIKRRVMYLPFFQYIREGSDRHILSFRGKYGYSDKKYAAFPGSFPPPESFVPAHAHPVSPGNRAKTLPQFSSEKDIQRIAADILQCLPDLLRCDNAGLPLSSCYPAIIPQKILFSADQQQKRLVYTEADFLQLLPVRISPFQKTRTLPAKSLVSSSCFIQLTS